MLLVGTDQHLEDVDRQYTIAEDVAVHAIAAATGGRSAGTAYVLLDGERLAKVEAFDLSPLARLAVPTGQSLAAGERRLLVGTAGAHLTVVDLLAREAVPVASFDAVAGRETWHNPGGATPDLRSLAITDAGSWLAAVHVGGVWRSTDDGASWTNVVAPDVDVHEVVAGAGGRLVAASAVGFGWSDDDGATWHWTAEGMHAAYARAVALDGDSAFVTASTGPRTTDGRLYRCRLGAPLVPCTDGLPPSFPFNLDSGSLAARGGEVALGTREGEVFRSRDGGRTFERLTERLPPIRVVRFA